MEQNSKIYIAGHGGLVGSSITKSLTSKGFGNIITRTHTELDLTDSHSVKIFFEEEKLVLMERLYLIQINQTAPKKNLLIYPNYMNWVASIS